MDLETWEEISKDIRRTRSDLSFFSKSVTYEFDFEQDVVLRRNSSKKEDRKSFGMGDHDIQEETHGDRLARILFIYAKLNPGVKYTQGMNEVLAILYFCFHG